jgi:hypothetical protein
VTVGSFFPLQYIGLYLLDRKCGLLVMTPEDEPADALDEMARDIALIEPEPKDWGVWVNYLLESLQSEAQKERKSAADEEMLLNLREALETRIGEANGKNPKGCVGLD